MDNTFVIFLFLFGILPEMEPSALANPEYRWRYAIVPYRFDSSVSLPERKIIAEAMEEIHQKTCVRFLQNIKRAQDYLWIIKPPRQGYCVANNGRKGHIQALYFGDGCYSQRGILWELMFTLGFIHEHNRPDRDKYVTINWGNISEECKKDFKKENATFLTLLNTPYDYDSIMHYPANGCGINGSVTIVPKNPNVTLSNNANDSLSSTDVERINRYYRCGIQGANDKEPRMYIPLQVIAVILVSIVLIASKQIRNTKKQKKALKHLYEQLMREISAPQPTLQLSLDQNISDLPYKKKYELERERILIGIKIGEGHFGRVWMGRLKRSQVADTFAESETLPIAIKGPQNERDPEHHKALADELKILCAIEKHPNVLALIGAVTKNLIHGEFFVVTEFCGNGNLKKILESRKANFIDELRPVKLENITYTILHSSKTSRYANEVNQEYANGQINLYSTTPSLSTSDLLSFAMQIAQGMDYLSSLPCIHRDLAARNVLITSNFICRVADFGLARHENKNYYRLNLNKNALVPYRWLSIEAIEQGLFTVESDIWSYGILLYEIFTLGSIPYSGIGNDKLLAQLKNGYRNPKPNYCHEEIYQLMQQCWQEEVAERPTFLQCTSFMKSHLERSSPQLLKKVEKYIIKDSKQQKNLVNWIGPGAQRGRHNQEYYQEEESQAGCIFCSSRTGLIFWCIYESACVVDAVYKIFLVGEKCDEFTEQWNHYDMWIDWHLVIYTCRFAFVGLILTAAILMKFWLLKLTYWITIGNVSIGLLLAIIPRVAKISYKPLFSVDLEYIFSNIVFKGLLVWAIKGTINSTRPRNGA